MPNVQTLSYVFIDNIPTRYVMREGRDYDYPEQVAAPEELDLPEPYAAIVTDVADRPDDVICDGCNTGIGWVLIEDDEAPARGGLQFRAFSIVQLAPEAVSDISDRAMQPARPALACEDCSPENLYYVRQPTHATTTPEDHS